MNSLKKHQVSIPLCFSQFAIKDARKEFPRMNDAIPTSIDNDCPESVRTLHGRCSCPVCGSPLKDNQTVCSGRCRIERSRRRREKATIERDAKVRMLLDEALRLLQGEK